MKEYDIVIGIEAHVQLNTDSKAFSTDGLSFGEQANRHTSVVSLAHPGSLPVANPVHLEKAIALALALNCDINHVSYFDRKHYFYPDLPKAYQITQDRKPYCQGGQLTIQTNKGSKVVKIHHIHLEEDAGKTIHDRNDQYALIDLNRAGTPLVELVTKPCIHSSEEVLQFMSTLQTLIRYIDISDGDMEKGSFRCDINVSIKPKGSNTLGTRCEIKNVNSKKFAKKAVDYEVERQKRILNNGGMIVQSTLHFDPVSGTTSPLRDKESAEDYRYFPDPDLPPLIISSEKIKNIKVSLPALPWKVKSDLMTQYGVEDKHAEQLSKNKVHVDLFFHLSQKIKNYKLLSNFLLNKFLSVYDQKKWTIEELSTVVDLIELIDQKLISTSTAYAKLWPKMIEDIGVNVRELASELNLLQVNDEGAIEEVVTRVLEKFSKQTAEYKSGKKKIFGFLFGQVMRESNGAFAPDLLKKALSKMLD